MKIDLSSVNRQEFFVSDREILDGEPVVLICPTKGKHQWVKEELHLRSLLCREDGTIICSGFPKFFNYGEDKDFDLVTQNAIVNGEAKYFEKMDGSLIIRTIINGKVSFRTRGSSDLGEFTHPVMSIVKQKYPLLLDPNFSSSMDMSLLFEYVSPGNKIILNYSQPDLYFLGFMIIYSNEVAPRYYPPSALPNISERLGIKSPKEYDLGCDLDAIRNQVSGWQGKEGIVIGVPREGGSYLLTKLKTEEYIKLHSLRYHLSDAKIEQICWAGDILEEEALRKILTSAGLDWEVTAFVSPIFQKYLDKRIQKEQELVDFLNLIEKEGLSKLEDKKEIAMALKDICDEDTKLFPIGIYYLTEGHARYETARMSFLMDVSSKSVKSYLQEGKSILASISSNDSPSEMI